MLTFAVRLMCEVLEMQEKKIGEIIAEQREKAGYSQRQLAKIANISNANCLKEKEVR